MVFDLEPRRIGPGTSGLGRLVLLSLLLHAAVGGAIWLSYTLSTRRAPPIRAIKTKLVRLGRKPDALPSKTPPKQVAEPPAPAPEPVAPKPTPSPEPVAPPPEPVPVKPAAQPQAVAKKPPAPTSKKPRPRKKEPPQPVAEKRDVASALDRLRRLGGSQAGDVSGVQEGELTDVERSLLANKYATEVYRCIKRHYALEGLEASAVQGREAVVVVHVKHDGRLHDAAIEASSGLPLFDASVLRAVDRCGRVSPPEQALEAVIAHGMQITFRP